MGWPNPGASVVGAALVLLAIGAAAPAPVTADRGARAASMLRPASKNYGGIEVRQAGGTDEPVIATFKKAACNRFAGGFRAVAKATSANGSYRLSVDISAEHWKGYAHHYVLFRKNDQYESEVRVEAPGDTVYDSTVAVPGGTGGGGIAFAPKGAAISVAGVFFLEDDTEVGIAVSGAMSCTYKKQKRRR
jgi:hypothetical protein